MHLTLKGLLHIYKAPNHSPLFLSNSEFKKTTGETKRMRILDFSSSQTHKSLAWEDQQNPDPRETVNIF